MNILLTTLNAKYIHTSLALRYLKAYCKRDFDVDIVEYTIKDPVLQVVSDLYVRKPDVIGFSCYIWNIEQTLEIVRLLKKVLPDVTVVLGGPEVSYDTKEWMEREPDVDFIVMGEGEATFHHLLQELQGDRKFHFVFGCAYRKGGEVVINPPRPKLDLNDIPTPHRFPEDLPDLGKRVIYFETSRGCPFSCQFCLSSIEVGVRYFDIERAKADLKYLIDSGAKLVKFVDRTFNIKRDYAMDIFRFLIENHNGCVFQFEITADIMRPEVLDFLSEHAPPGIFRFEIGVQSTNDLTNELIMRRQNFAKLSRTVTKIRESGKIAQHLDLIAGLPEENYDSFRKTFNDVFALRPEELQLGFLKLLRGTGLRRDADKYGYIWMDKAPYEVLANHVLSFDDVVRIKRVEDVLEKYWNAHRMDHTVEFLVRRAFPSAFDFFQEFGDYWEARGWQRIGHQLEDLFVRLQQFLTHKGIAELDVAIGLMKLDYFLNHRYKPRKIWWTFEPGKSGLQELMRLFAGQAERISPELAAMRLSEKDLYKHAVAEVLPFDLAEVLADLRLEDGTGGVDRPGVATDSSDKTGVATDMSAGSGAPIADGPAKDASIASIASVAAGGSTSDEPVNRSPDRMDDPADRSLTASPHEPSDRLIPHEPSDRFSDGFPRDRSGRFPVASRNGGGRRTALLVVYPPDGSGARWFAAAMEGE